MLTLFEEEQTKIELFHKRQFEDLETQFQKFRAAAAEEQAKLSLKVRFLDIELASAKEQLTNMKAGPQAEHTETPSMVPSELPPNSLGSQGTVFAPPTLLVQQLMRDRASKVPNYSESGPTADRQHNAGIPDSFIPALAQYLSLHKTALKEWEDKYNALKAERDLLKQTLEGTVSNILVDNSAEHLTNPTKMDMEKTGHKIKLSSRGMSFSSGPTCI